MLEELRLSNFTLMEREVVRFAPGLNVITGETGSGKSLLLHGLELVLGARMKPHLLKSGEDAEVEALFSLEDLSDKLRLSLPELFRDQQELVVTRSVSSGGRSKVYINGRLASVSLLQDTVTHLVNICAQNQQVRLLDPRYHRELLDDFGGLESLLAKYQQQFEHWRELAEELRLTEEATARDQSRRGELEALVEEIAALQLRPGLRSELEVQVKRLGSAEQLVSRGEGMLNQIEQDGGLQQQLQQMGSQLQDLLRLDPSLDSYVELFKASRVQFEEFEQDLRRYIGNLSIDDRALAEAREQLAEVARVERKYRTNDAGLLQLLTEARRSLELLGDQRRSADLAMQVRAARTELEALAEQLSEKRLKKGKELAHAVIKELQDLSMAGTDFRVHQERKELAADGADSIEYLISTIKQESPKPLRQVASGGELSRIMLVLKKVLRERTGVNVLVFDEVDSGISGSVARGVGEKLRSLAEGSQVLCITHLPQVASLADQHILVQKRLGKRTSSTVTILDEAARIDEIARMLAGHSITAAARRSAEELLLARGVAA